MFKLRSGERDRQAKPVDCDPPDNWLQFLPAVLGMPVECEAPKVTHRPWLTIGLSVGIAALVGWLFASDNLLTAARGWGFIPNQWSRHGGLTVLTSFFLHAGLVHMISNLYFFLVFGDNVEDHLGRVRFLLLLAGAHVAGTILHGAFDPRGGIPCVGASAGIAGVIAYYAVVFPHAKLGLMIRWCWLRISAIWALVLYTGLQLLGAWMQLEGFSNVSCLAHLGGLAVGVVAGLVTRNARGVRLPQSARSTERQVGTDETLRWSGGDVVRGAARRGRLVSRPARRAGARRSRGQGAGVHHPA